MSPQVWQSVFPRRTVMLHDDEVPQVTFVEVPGFRPL